jgi:hypothetical protein
MRRVERYDVPAQYKRPQTQSPEMVSNLEVDCEMEAGNWEGGTSSGTALLSITHSALVFSVFDSSFTD